MTHEGRLITMQMGDTNGGSITGSIGGEPLTSYDKYNSPSLYNQSIRRVKRPIRFTNLTRETYDALCKSTYKWWLVAFGGRDENGGIDCILCHECDYNCNFVLRAGKCPVYELSGGEHCDNTPYTTWSVNSYSDDFGRKSWAGPDNYGHLWKAQTAAKDFYYWLQNLRDMYRDQLEESDRG